MMGVFQYRYILVLDILKNSMILINWFQKGDS